MTGKELEVTDLSVAWHAIKITHELERMQKERNALRTGNLNTSYILEQLEIERQRLTAAADGRTERLNKKLNALKEKVATWFKNEVTNNASWLNGKTRLTLSGITLYYSGDGVIFYFPEIAGGEQ